MRLSWLNAENKIHLIDEHSLNKSVQLVKLNLSRGHALDFREKFLRNNEANVVERQSKSYKKTSETFPSISQVS